MITDQDVAKLKKTFVTKKEFKTLSNNLGDLSIEVGELREQINSLDTKIDTKIDHLNTKLDAFLGQLDDLQKDNTVGAGVQARHTRQIESIAEQGGFILPA